MKNEFLYTLRLYTGLLVATGDFLRLKDLIVEYRLLTTWEEEQKAAKAFNKETALANLMGLSRDEHEGEEASAGGVMEKDKSRVIRVDEKKYFMVCGMEKKEVF